MAEPQQVDPTIPEPPESRAPLSKRAPILLVLGAMIVLIGIANLSHLARAKTTMRNQGALRPSTVSPRQVRSYEVAQATQAREDAAHPPAAAALSPQVPDLPGPEADTAPPMTPAQRAAIYGDGNPDAPQRTSEVSQEHAEARQRALARQKLRQDALASDTVAIDFSQGGSSPAPARGSQPVSDSEAVQTVPASPTPTAEATTPKSPMAPYDVDSYQGQLYRVFEGTVLEGVVTNHIDGALNGPVLVMLTTDYYSHDHQQLLMPQGTRLIGSVQSVSMQGQRRLVVTFHRAVCPDGFSLDFDRYPGLDPIGTTGLSGHVDNHLLSSFAAAAAIGGLGGLAQIGNTANIFTPSTQVRDGISSQTSQEGEQILNHFLNRLPVITLKEGSRARVYIGRDILIPSYAEHTVNPSL